MGYELGASFRELHRAIWIDWTEGAKRELQTCSLAVRRQVEARDPNSQAEVKRAHQLEVPVLCPLRHHSQHRTIISPVLDEESSQPRFEGQPCRLGTKHRLTPPAVGVHG